MQTFYKQTHPWRFLTLLISMSLAFGLTGCGFHLKGMGNSAQATYQTIRLIDVEKVRPDIRQALTQQLAGMNVTIVNNLADAEVAVTFQATAFSATRTGLTGQGDTSSQLLKMSQSIVVDDMKSGQKLLATTVTSFRDRSIDNNNLQASSRELGSIQRQMASDVALQVIDRVNRVYSQQNAVKRSGQ